ncbi:hypothetical protein B0H17DRAFT_1137673 [Mycena rosella]|uniref:Uncharacterized protein n=1 Tax=Mycena rosella TaxID=1033263 RepID=A0AAD7GAF6_MYCRO|nr:hypothetical protein B0H17DRAFT_1137673 [Mycena rosella]
MSHKHTTSFGGLHQQGEHFTVLEASFEQQFKKLLAGKLQVSYDICYYWWADLMQGALPVRKETDSECSQQEKQHRFWTKGGGAPLDRDEKKLLFFSLYTWCWWRRVGKIWPVGGSVFDQTQTSLLHCMSLLEAESPRSHARGDSLGNLLILNEHGHIRPQRWIIYTGPALSIILHEYTDPILPLPRLPLVTRQANSFQMQAGQTARLQLGPQVELQYQLLELVLAQEAAELASGAAQPQPLNNRGVQHRTAWEMARSCDTRDVPLTESDLYVGPEHPGTSVGIAIAMPASGSGLSALGPARSA